MNINIGGSIFNFPNGSNISVSNGKVVVNGQEIHSVNNLQPIIIEVTGDVNNIRSNNTVKVTGSVLGSVDAGNSVECGDVSGDVDAGNSVHARDIKGKVKAGNSIHKSFQ
jgi:hypothetical protein